MAPDRLSSGLAQVALFSSGLGALPQVTLSTEGSGFHGYVGFSE